MPKVSVIMGVYNCENTLSNSIESILKQTYTDWELIICDDCSSDNTFEVAQKYSIKYKNIILIKNTKNMGLAFCLNECLKIAKGNYIARMDGDDICLPDRFNIQVEFLNNHLEYQVVGSSVILFDENGEKSIRKMVEIPTKYDFANTVPHIHPTIMMRKEIYNELNGYTVSPKTRRGQDMDLWFRFYAQGFRGYNIEQPLLKYHESIVDYKKRSLKNAVLGVQRRYIGYKMLGLQPKYYIYAFKPLISAIIPNNVLYLYHKNSNR